MTAGTVELFTMQDAIDHVVEYLQEQTSPGAARDARRAVLSAWREFANAHSWSYWCSHGRINTNAPYNTGTIAYDHTGGSIERQLTLSSGTWPDWAEFGQIEISGVLYQIAVRVSASVLQLEANNNPGADVASGSSYNLFRDTYPCPPGMVNVDQMQNVNSWGLEYIHPRDWLRLHRHSAGTSGDPRMFTIMGSPDHQSNLAFRLWPFPSDSASIDFTYQARPRLLTIPVINTGTVSVSSGSSTITGTGTTFTSNHIGAVFRLSENSSTPTGRHGANPFVAERVIMSRASATSVEADQDFADSYSGVGYTISSPLDIEPGSMLTAFLRCCEKEIAIQRRLKDRREVIEIYRDALIMAKETDSRYTGPRSVYGEGGWYRRLADYPSAADVE